MSALAEQMTLFPVATELEINECRKLLNGYRRMKQMVEALEKQTMTEKQRIAHADFLTKTRSIEMAVNLLDSEIRKIIEYRFLRGEQHKYTLMHFSNYHQTTIDRKIKRGINMVADNLLMLD